MFDSFNNTKHIKDGRKITFEYIKMFKKRNPDMKIIIISKKNKEFAFQSIALR